MSIYIYCLGDPLTNEVRYVGLTRNLGRRYKQYIKGRGHTRHLRNWVECLRLEDRLPDLKIVGECSESDASFAERYWIYLLSTNGCRLLNLTSGGERAYSLSPEYRKALSESAKRGIAEGRRKIPVPTPEARRKIAEACRARGGNPDRFIAMNKARIGISLSEDHKRKVSASLKGRIFSPEHRDKLRLAAAQRRESKR